MGPRWEPVLSSAWAGGRGHHTSRIAGIQTAQRVAQHGAPGLAGAACRLGSWGLVLQGCGPLGRLPGGRSPGRGPAGWLGLASLDICDSPGGASHPCLLLIFKLEKQPERACGEQFCSFSGAPPRVLCHLWGCRRLLSMTVTLGSSVGHHSEAPGDIRAPHLAPSAPGRPRYSANTLPVPDLSGTRLQTGTRWFPGRWSPCFLWPRPHRWLCFLPGEVRGFCTTTG